MRLQLFTNGSRFDLYAIDLNDTSEQPNCPVIEFLEELAASNPKSHKSIAKVLQMHAEHGPLHNTQKSRLIDKQARIYEFKNQQGARILYFYASDVDRLTVLTHGFNKGSNLKQETTRARYLQRQYYWRESTR